MVQQTHTLSLIAHTTSHASGASPPPTPLTLPNSEGICLVGQSGLQPGMERSLSPALNHVPHHLIDHRPKSTGLLFLENKNPTKVFSSKNNPCRLNKTQQSIKHPQTKYPKARKVPNSAPQHLHLSSQPISPYPRAEERAPYHPEP